ncbi:MAG TPA: ATP-binding protein [Nitrosospira sp.]|nr:ATP-binding protein [Nitrosospira sp.]
MIKDDEEALLRSVALQTSRAILHARQRAEQDLQQAKKALEDKTRQLDHSLSILRATMDATAEGILVTDEEGNVLRHNELYLQLWPIDSRLVTSACHSDLMACCASFLKEPQEFLRKTRQIYAEWPPDSYDLLELTDGRVFERYSKIHYIEERYIGRVWSYRDVTARRQAEEAARETRDRLRFMSEVLPLKIFTAQADGNADYFNRQWVEYAGVTLERLLGWEWTKLISSDDANKSMERWRHSLQTGEAFQVDHRLRHANGDYRWHLTRAQAKRAYNGSISMWVGSSIDIDAMKRADEERKQLLASERIARSEAEQVNRVKDEFLATLSHELRTPLNAILGWSQLILQGSMDEQNVQRGMEIIERNARAQNKLIEDLLEMSRIISGKVSLDIHLLDLASIAHAAVESLTPLAEAKGIRIRNFINHATGKAAVDHNRVQQIICNLLSNAIKFTPGGGYVDIIVQRVGPHAEIAVKDSGIGIKPEFLKYVFERFRQADSSSTRRHGGLGLGLAIVKQLVLLHGGTVRAESEGEGQGSSFTVSLPLTPMGAEEIDAHDRQGRFTTCARFEFPGARILVIDDEEDSLELMREILAKCGAVVMAASSAAEALEIVKNEKPSVIISDIGMPDMDGYDFMREVRNLPDTQGGKARAIAVTGFVRPEDRADAVAAGYQMHFSKPVDPRQLVSAVGELLGPSRSAV